MSNVIIDGMHIIICQTHAKLYWIVTFGYFDANGNMHKFNHALNDEDEN